ncbi:MAG TPA: site-specific integrase [Actinobacteria bacterium]|nr:site-specific integrase [Actinomycetota bacterium]
MLESGGEELPVRSLVLLDDPGRHAELVRRGTYISPVAGKITLRAFSESWLASRTFGPTTAEATELRLRLRLHIWPVLGGKLLSQVTPSVIQSWVRGLKGSASSKKIMLTLLSPILGAAVDDGLVARNQTHAKSVKAPEPGKRKIEPWPAEQVAAGRAALPGRFQIVCDLGSGLGMRQGEILGLATTDVEWLRKGGAVVHIRRQVRIVGRRMVFAPPKGGKERDISLPESVALALAAHLEEYPARPVTLPWLEPGGQPVTVALVLTSAIGKAVNRNSFNTFQWKPALGKAGTPASRDNGTHALRHHFASVLLHGGVDVRALAEYPGHSDPGFTLRAYT